jgi:GT2 family glycosyltransferase
MIYVLITPAKNEAAYIELTIKSMISQTHLPLKWVIVSDGSTDGTDDIVKEYIAHYPWIELLRTPERTERHFAGKVYAFNVGYDTVKAMKYDIIGNLDADLTFGEDYMEFLLNRFSDNPQLGIAGTPFREDEQQYDYRFASTDHVSGACQLFRRECFEAIGGYPPLKAGGIDLAAVLTARMKGWQAKTFMEKTSIHHKKTQAGNHASLKALFHSGYHDYLMGSHPLWQLSRSIFHMSKKPYFLVGTLLLTGYIWAMMTRAKRTVPHELVVFRGKDQMRRLKDMVLKFFASKKLEATTPH